MRNMVVHGKNIANVFAIVFSPISFKTVMSYIWEDFLNILNLIWEINVFILT